MYAVHWFVYYAIEFWFTGTLRILLDCTHYALCSWMLLPVTVWVAESLLGRYRAIIAALIMSAIFLLLLQSGFVMENLDWTPIPGFVLTIVAAIFAVFQFGVGDFYNAAIRS